MSTVKLSNLMRTRNSIRFVSIRLISIRFGSFRFDFDLVRIKFESFTVCKIRRLICNTQAQHKITISDYISGEEAKIFGLIKTKLRLYLGDLGFSF